MELRLALLKIYFPYHLKTLSFCLSKSPKASPNRNWWTFTLVQPQVLTYEEILDSFHVLMLKLSFTRDMAKYLDFYTLQRWCTFPTRLGFTKTRSFISLPLDQNGRSPNLSFPYHQLSIWLSYCNLYDPGRAHNAKWLHLKLLNIWPLKSLCSWVAIHKWDTQGKP